MSVQISVQRSEQSSDNSNSLTKSDEYSEKLFGVIAEAEIYNNTIYIFDILFMNNKDIRTESLQLRLSHAHKLIAAHDSTNKFKMALKKYCLPHEADTVFERAEIIIKQETKKLPNDGLVFVSPDKYFNPIFKWKPLSHCSIDFLVLLDDRKNIHLFVTITKKVAKQYRKRLNKRTLSSQIDWDSSFYVPYEFAQMKPTSETESGEEIKDGQVVECRYDVKRKRWIPMRVRHDKTDAFRQGLRSKMFVGPNAFLTALSMWRYIKNPITKEQIQDKKTGDKYFTGIDRNEAEIKPMLNFHNWIKMQMYIEVVKKGHTVLELAGGRGGDLFKLEK